MQPGLRLVLTTNCDEEVIENKIKKWAGEYLNSEFFDGKKIFNIISNNGLKGIVQQILIIIQESNEELYPTKLIIESAIKSDEEDDPSEQVAGSPDYDKFRPLSIISDLLEDGDWIRNGNNITNKPKEITFDNVDRDLNLIKQSSEMLPQVIIGWGGRGDLPSVNPNDIAIILSGLANVHVPASGGTLELMNQKLESLGISSGGVRLFLNHPSKNLRQPLYSAERVRGKNGRPFVLDIFLRLAKQTLIGAELEILTTNNTEQKLEHIQKIDDELERISSHLEAVIEINQELDEENKKYKLVNEKLEEKLSTLEEFIEEFKNKNIFLAEENERLEDEKQIAINERKERASQDKQKIKGLEREKNQYIELAEDFDNYEGLKKERELLDPFLEVINQFYKQNEGIEDDDFVELFKNTLIPNEINQYDSISSVLQFVHQKMGDSFIILPSAFTSAKKHKTFKYARRIMEAFEMMEKCLGDIRSLPVNTRIDYKRNFRRISGNFAVANKETKTTMQQFSSEREFIYDKKKIIMEPHIKIGSGGDDETARIHFKYVKKYQKYVIGHCGLHLSTHAGR